MLGAVCGRHTKWNLSNTSLHLHSHSHSHIHIHNPPLSVSGAASVWRMIIPGGGDWRADILSLPLSLHQHNGEGSWNVAWDARPARWLHRLHLCLLLFPLSTPPSISISPYRVTGVPADGRCLFRAIAHGAFLHTANQPPDANRQTDLADQLRAQVVDELLKRRKQVECFIEEDFDAYVKRIQQPYVWGGEPELLMASHVLRKLITVFIKDRNTGDLTKIANYGEEYKKDDEPPIHVLFYGYGHYDILETCYT